MMSDFDNLDVMIGNENMNPIERELASAIVDDVHDDVESNIHPRDEFRNFSYENSIPGQDRVRESMKTFANEFNL